MPLQSNQMTPRPAQAIFAASLLVYFFALATIILIAHQKHWGALHRTKLSRTSLLQLDVLEEFPEPVEENMELTCPQNITVTDILSLMHEDENVSVVDVRSSVEYQQGHPPGAINIPAFTTGGKREFLSSFLSRFNASVPEKGSKVFILSNCLPYTFDCLWGRELQASRMLCDAGYVNVSFVTGGMEKWRHLRLPLKLGI